MSEETGVSLTETGYAVRCPLHGLVYPTNAEYMRQMMSANYVWRCPVPSDTRVRGTCHLRAFWSDEIYERVFCANDDEENEPNV